MLLHTMLYDIMTWWYHDMMRSYDNRCLQVKWQWTSSTPTTISGRASSARPWSNQPTLAAQCYSWYSTYCTLHTARHKMCSEDGWSLVDGQSTMHGIVFIMMMIMMMMVLCLYHVCEVWEEGTDATVDLNYNIIVWSRSTWIIIVCLRIGIAVRHEEERDVPRRLLHHPVEEIRYQQSGQPWCRYKRMDGLIRWMDGLIRWTDWLDGWMDWLDGRVG